VTALSKYMEINIKKGRGTIKTKGRNKPKNQ